MPALKNARHERFVQELVQGRSHRDAYRLAGYPAHKGHGARLARRPAVAQRYDELFEAAARETEVSAARIIKELAAIAFAKITDFVTIDADGKPQTDLSKMTGDNAAALVEVSHNEHRVRFKLADKLAALIALGRMLGMFRERVELTGVNGGPIKEPLSDFEAAKRIAFVLARAAHQREAQGLPTIPSSAGLDQYLTQFTGEMKEGVG